MFTSVLEPRHGGGDVVSGALALELDEDPHVVEVSADPLVEGGEELQSVRGGRHVNSHGAAILRRVPARVRATAISGLVTKQWVAGLASLRPRIV